MLIDWLRGANESAVAYREPSFLWILERGLGIALQAMQEKKALSWRGNGNPLQCSCLENPRDRGAWWAAVYGVAQSRTRLKRLSSNTIGLELSLGRLGVRLETLSRPGDTRQRSVHGILQARILEWVAMPSSRGSS